MEEMECQYHRQHAVELGQAMQRIAVAAGIELAQPKEIADIVCARLARMPSRKASLLIPSQAPEA